MLDVQTLRFDTEEDWLAFRKGHLTGTSLGTFLGLNKYTKWSPAILTTKPEFEHHFFLNLGKLLEPTVLKIGSHILGKQYKSPGGYELLSCESLNLLVTPDSFNEETKEPLECKTMNPRAFKNVIVTGYPPEHYLVQLYAQMMLLKSDTGVLGILNTDMSINGFGYITIKLKRDEEIDSIILSEVKALLDNVDHQVTKETTLRLKGLLHRASDYTDYTARALYEKIL